MSGIQACLDGASRNPCAKISCPPAAAPDDKRPSVFLAGSIDMGAADDWQVRASGMMAHLPISIFNPRRPDWDPSWIQDISHDGFRGQVEWELDHLDRAEIVLFHFDPSGKAPVTMMELGLHGASGKCIVSCPPGYWRRGNIQVLCARYRIPLWDNLTAAIGNVEDIVLDIMRLGA